MEEHKRAYALMVRAHSAAILPPSINDIPEFREYLEYISRGGYAIPHRTKTTEIEDAAVIEWKKRYSMMIVLIIHNLCLNACMHVYVHVQWPGVNEPAFQFDICSQYMQLYMKHICIMNIIYLIILLILLPLSCLVYT